MEKKPGTRPFVRSVAALAAALIAQSAVLAPLAEASLWEDRRRAANQMATPSRGPVLLAQATPSFSATAGPVPTAASERPWPGDGTASWPQDRPITVLIQDAHRIPSTQLDISRALGELARRPGRLLVGVEGASGAFHLAPLRRWTDPSERAAVSDYLVREHFLNGAEHFGVTAEVEPTLWGVEAPDLYERNVVSLRTALDQQARTRRVLDALRARVNLALPRELSPRLLAWNRLLQDHHDGRLDFASFVAALAARRPPPPEVAAFLRLVEGEPDPGAVERDRRAFLERLTARLTPAETAALLRESAALRVGEAASGDYYDRWRRFAAARGLRWADYPHLGRHVELARLAAGLSPARLLEQVDELRQEVGAGLGETPRERQILDLAEDIRRLDRLTALSLGPGDWAVARGREAALSRIGERVRTLDGPSPGPDPMDLRPYFDFYRTAEERNAALAERLTTKARELGARTTALVAGGFHTPGLLAELRARGSETFVITPRVGALVEGTPHLDAFTVRRTPLERMLLGERLDLAPASRLAAVETDPALRDAATMARVLMGLKESASVETFGEWSERARIPAEPEYRGETRGARVPTAVGPMVAVTLVEPEPGEEDPIGEPLELRTESGPVSGRVTRAPSTQASRWTALLSLWPEFLGAGLVAMGVLPTPLPGFDLGLAWAAGGLWYGLFIRVLLALCAPWPVRGAVLGCGVIGVLYSGPNPSASLYPAALRALLQGAIRRTLHRGGQSAGAGFMAAKENGSLEVAWLSKKVAKEQVDRRRGLFAMVAPGMDRLAAEAQRKGWTAMDRVLHIVHLRYGTNLARTVAVNAHPHQSEQEEDEVFFIGDERRDDKYERPWNLPAGRATLKRRSITRGAIIAHNGDDNQTTLHRSRSSLVATNVPPRYEDRELSEKMTGFINPAGGDSPQIATRLSRWITQGSVRGSLRMGVLMALLETLSSGDHPSFDQVLEAAPTREAIEECLSMRVFESFAQRLSDVQKRHPNALDLESLFWAAGAAPPSHPAGFTRLEDVITLDADSDADSLRQLLADHGRDVLGHFEWFRALEEARKDEAVRNFADQFLKAFFLGDLRRAGYHLLERSDHTSTYGVMGASLSEPENAVFICRGQAFYLWLSEDGHWFGATSEPTAFLGDVPGAPSLRYRLTMRHGEIAFLRGDRLVIDHVDRGRVADYPLRAAASRDPRWIDVLESPRIPTPDGTDVPPERRVETDVRMIPRVNQALAEDFRDPGSDNARAGRALADLMVRRPKTGRSLDLVVVGTEKSRDEAENFADTVRRLSSLAGRPLNVRVVNAPDFDRDALAALRDGGLGAETRDALAALQGAGLGAETVVLGISASGQTANTFYVMEALHEAWKGSLERSGRDPAAETPPHFLVSAHMDNPFTENILGQGLAAGAPFLERNFVTFPRGLDPFHDAEAATVTHKAAERLLKEVAYAYAQALSARRWKNNRITSETLSRLRRMIENGDELDRRVLGVDENGNAYSFNREKRENDLPARIEAVARRLSGAFLETLWAAGATVLFIALTLELHATPASLLFFWFPNDAFFLAGEMPLLVAGFGATGLAAGGWVWKKHGMHPLFGTLTVLASVSLGLFAGQAVHLLVDAAGLALGWGPLSGSLGGLPLPLPVLDESPVTMLNIATYSLFAWLVVLGLRRLSGRPLWDRMGGRVLTIVEGRESYARLGAARFRKMLALRFGWIGPASINHSTLADLTHEEAANGNVRGGIFVQGIPRGDEAAGAMNFKQLGGTPNGPGRAWRIGIGHAADGGPAYSEGYISLAMEGDDPAAGDPDLRAIQALLQDAPARDTASLALSLAVARRVSDVGPFRFTIGRSPSEAKTSTTQQPKPPLSQVQIRQTLGLPTDTPQPEEPEATEAPARSAAVIPISSRRDLPRVVDPRPSTARLGARLRTRAGSSRLVSIAVVLLSLGLAAAYGPVKDLLHSPEPAPAAFAATTISLQPATRTVVSEHGGPVNLRESPGRRGRVISVLPAGLVVHFLDKGKDAWVKVRVPGGPEGFINAKHLTEGGQVPALQPITPEGSYFQFPHSSAVAVSLSGDAPAVALGRLTRDGRVWTLVQRGQQLAWTPGESLPATDQTQAAADLAHALLDNADPVGPIGDTSLTVSASAASLALGFLAAASAGSPSSRRRALDRHLEARGIPADSPAARAAQDLAETLASVHAEPPVLEGTVPVVNCAEGWTRDFGYGVGRILSRRLLNGGKPMIFLVRNAAQKGHLKKRLRRMGVGPSHESLVRIVRMDQVAVVSPEQEMDPPVRLGAVLDAGLTSAERRELQGVQIVMSPSDRTAWDTAGLDGSLVSLMFLLGRHFITAPLDAADRVRSALRVLSSA